MSPEEKVLVKTTWAMVVPIADVAATLFYERLFALDSSLRPMFDRTDMKEQRRKLLAALGTVVNGLDNLEPLIPVLESLGRSHSRYSVKDAHYEPSARHCFGRSSKVSGKPGHPQRKPRGRRPMGQ
jgi:hemoglobin-like flavoprotein